MIPGVPQITDDLDRQWKQRLGPSGIHFFERTSGLNILLDELAVPRELWSSAPRQVSIALTNRCDLACAHCYAPKSRDELTYEDVTRWIQELDVGGCLGVGFGGGEPTLYPRFAELCQYAAQQTRLAVTFTTHGHHIDDGMAARLRGNVHFIRVSMDGIGSTYEAVRRRPFAALKKRLDLIRSICPFGINIVVNEQTLDDLNGVAAIAEDYGASELLLLPQAPVRRVSGIDETSLGRLRSWVVGYEGPLKLSISEPNADSFPTCEPLPDEVGLAAYAHIDATGVLKPTSFHSSGVRIGSAGVMDAVIRLSRGYEEDDA